MKRSIRWATVGVGAVALCLVLLFAATGVADREDAQRLVGRVAPVFSAKTATGQTFRIDGYRGTWLLVNFFATWCAPCIAEQPELVRFAAQHRSRSDANIVSVAFNDDASAVQKFFAERGGDWPVVAEGAEGIAVDWGVVKLPESYLVDPAGIVVHKFIGGVTAAEIDSVIDQKAKSLGGRPEAGGK